MFVWAGEAIRSKPVGRKDFPDIEHVNKQKVTNP